MNARRANIKEPVEVENTEATENDTNDDPEVVENNEPEFEGVRPGDDEIPEGDLVFEEDEPEDEVVPEWYPNQPCLNCGARDYKYTVGWGAACSVCLNPPVDEE